MAIAPTGAIYKALEFDGTSSRTFGVYITGEAVYNAPQRDVEMISIPGRNGAYALDKGRFENIEVTYPAGIFADTETDFAGAISDFRNYLCSRNGYVRLTDEYNPSEYRMAVYKSGLEVEPALLKGGEFDITFECKPQRWLTDGENKITLGSWGDTTTETGDIVEIDNSTGVISVKDDTIAIEAVQSGSGDPSPDNVRPITGWSNANVYRTGKNLIDVSDTEIGTAWNGISNSARARLVVELKAGTYTLSMNGTNGLDGGYYAVSSTVPPSGVYTLTFPQTITTTSTNKYFILGFNKSSIAQTDIDALNLQLELGSTATTYEPYNGNTYTISLGGTRYGGTLDVTTGTLTVTHGIVDLGTLTWSGNQRFTATVSDALKAVGGGTIPNWVCSSLKIATPNAVYANTVDSAVSFYGAKLIQARANSITDATAFKTAMDGVQLCYELATPTTVSLTAEDIELLTGTNYVWADTGDSTIEYGQDPNKIYNPTLFESSPLLEVEGYGTIGFNGYSIDLGVVPYGQIVIDDGESGSSSSNPYTLTVTFDTTKLNSGDAIYPETKDCRIMAILDADNSSRYFSDMSVASTTNALDASISWYNNSRRYQARMYLYPDFGTGFSYGTSKTITSTAVYNYTLANGTATTEQVQATIAYGGSDSYTITVQKSGTLDAHATRGSTFIYSPTMYGDSTMAISGLAIYMDCDLGEVYAIENDEYISLNQYVDLGSDLPTLASGANTVTYDNTFTSVKITPRWWKV